MAGACEHFHDADLRSPADTARRQPDFQGRLLIQDVSQRQPVIYAFEVVMLPKPRAFWISLCNLVGLGLSLIGVILLFFYALPPVVPGAPQAITAEGGSNDASRSFNRNAHIGLAL